MSVITKQLKYGTFQWDDAKKEFTLWILTRDDPPMQERISLNKTYAFAFFRFLIRVSQRNWYRKIRKEVTKK